MNTSDVIIKPLITESAINEATAGKYSFAVHHKAGKDQIKKAIADAFSVHPVTVKTRIVKGKTKRVGTKKTIARVTIWKKATVTVKKGEKISLFEPGGTKGEE